MADRLTTRVERSLRVAIGMATPYSLDAAREVAAETGRPVIVIASRRQVDGVEPGYVGWNTPQWCAAAGTGRGAGGLLLARDHGGPYQHPRDLGHRDPADVMRSAREALLLDIDSGVELLHVDTSVGADGSPETPDRARQRAVELINACTAHAAAVGRRVGFEVGLEVQEEQVADDAAFGEHMWELLGELSRYGNERPLFVVAQTGTKVTGRRNTGVLARRPDADPRRRLDRLARLVGALRSRLKAHNCDYLPGPAVTALRSCGAWMNISPEAGVAQTTAVLHAARAARLSEVVDDFCDATLRAGHWRRWLGDGPAADDDKVATGGSYLFATPAFAALRAELDRALAGSGRSTRRIATDAVKSLIRRYAG
jgi:hypothetical protein